jgi:hypothetical protein
MALAPKGGKWKPALPGELAHIEGEFYVSKTLKIWDETKGMFVTDKFFSFEAILESWTPRPPLCLARSKVPKPEKIDDLEWYTISSGSGPSVIDIPQIKGCLSPIIVSAGEKVKLPVGRKGILYIVA